MKGDEKMRKEGEERKSEREMRIGWRGGGRGVEELVCILFIMSLSKLSSRMKTRCVNT